MADFRDLCSELAESVEVLLALRPAEARTLWTTEDRLTRARAALAEPEPEGPTDEELVQTAIDTRLYRFQATAGDPIQYEMTEQQIHAFARAVLARWGTPNLAETRRSLGDD